jgi:hypothetical protein
MHLELEAAIDGLLDPDHPGWCGDLAAGDPSGLDGTLGGASSRARLDAFGVEGRLLRVDVVVDPAAPETPEPDLLGLNRVGRAAAWEFQL